MLCNFVNLIKLEKNKMAERIKSDSNFERGRRGLADVIRLSEENMRVDFYENEYKGVKEEAQSFNVKVVYGDDETRTIPDYLPFKKMKDGGKIVASLTMNKEGDKVLFAVPASGYFEVKFDQFVVPEKDAIPVMETKKGKKNTYRQFACLLEITGGTWQNLTIKDGVWLGAKYWFGLYDNFTAGVEGGLAVKGSGEGSDNLSDFLDATVSGGGQIKFSENPLPEIHKIAQELDTRFFVNVAKGWVKSIVVPLSLDDDAFVADDEEVGLSEAQKANIHPALAEE